MLYPFKMNKLFLILLLLLPSVIFGQSITGVLIDSEGQTLPYATVQLLDKDSSVYKVEASRTDGSFEFKGLNPEIYYVNISFLGYQSKSIRVDLSKDKGSMNIGIFVYI